MHPRPSTRTPLDRDDRLAGQRGAARFTRASVALSVALSVVMTLAMLVELAVTVPPAAAAARFAVGDVLDFPLPADSTPTGIAAGPDGNVWVANGTADLVTRVGPSGSIASFRLPNPNSIPTGIAAGPDGAMWFTERAGNRIGRITVEGQVSEFPLPFTGGRPTWITAGPPGTDRMYVTLPDRLSLAVVSMAGSISELALPGRVAPTSVSTVGPDVWYASWQANQVGRIQPDGIAAQFPMPPGSEPVGLAPAPGGGLWVTLAKANDLALLAPDGAVRARYPMRFPEALPLAVVTGPDGNAWVTEAGSGMLARVTSGAIPVAVSAPEISPASNIGPGALLRSSIGAWSYVPSSVSYQWQRCATGDPASCQDIPGATSASYFVGSADAGSWLRVGVTATSLGGSAPTSYAGLVPVAAALAAGTTPAAGTIPDAEVIALSKPTASIGQGARARLHVPRSQARRASAVYRIGFTSSQVRGLVTLEFRHGLTRRTVPALLVVDGQARARWVVPAWWPTGRTVVIARFTPAPSLGYQPAVLRAQVFVRG